MAAESAWLAGLEEKVRAAVERIAALRQENRTLAARVQELEARHAARPERSTGGKAAAWQEEREKVRERAERLTRMLEDLLAAADQREP